MHWSIKLDFDYLPRNLVQVYVCTNPGSSDPRDRIPCHFRTKDDAMECGKVLKTLYLERGITCDAVMVPIYRPDDTTGDGDSCPMCDERDAEKELVI